VRRSLAYPLDVFVPIAVPEVDFVQVIENTEVVFDGNLGVRQASGGELDGDGEP
jgi:hypothetical protein